MDSDLESSTPSLVECMDLERLQLLAKKSHPEGLSPDSEVGSFNVIWLLEFSNGLRRRESLVRHDPRLLERMRFNMPGYELIARRTSIPIPKIFAFSPEIDKDLGYPRTSGKWKSKDGDHGRRNGH